MTTSEPYLHEYSNADRSLVDPAAVPETLLDLMRFVAVEYLPEIAAHVDYANEWLDANPDIEAGTNGLDNPADRSLTGARSPQRGGAATFEWRGIELATGVMPYRFWLLQRLHDDLAAATADDQRATRAVFRSGDLEPLLDLRTIRRVERTDNLAVWGPA